MAALIRSFDWGRTSLGPIDEWPNSLKTAIGSMLMATIPIVTLWGEDGVMADKMMQSAGRSIASSVGRQIGNQLLRGIFGGLLRGR